MSKILKVDQGDYVIQVEPGGYIVLDAGATGKIALKGEVELTGAATTISSVDTTIADNVITLNDGETGSGINVPIKGGISGIVIDRGTINSNAASAQFLFSESEDAFNPLTGSRLSGAFLLRTTSGTTNTLSNLKITTAELRAISNTGANSIEINLSNSNGVVALVNSTNTVSNLEYHQRVTENSLVNKKYVTTYVESGTITTGMADVDKLYKRNLTNQEKSKILATTTALEFSINASNIATIQSGGLYVNTINPYTGSIISLNSVVGISDQTVAPSVIAGKTVVYSQATVGSGKSGLFFKNNTVSDELVAKNRALLFSMLF